MNQYRLVSERDVPSTEFDLARVEELSNTDALFAMLDGQIIRGRRAAWRAEVVSILTEHDATWVQIGPAQRPAMSVLMRIASGHRADEALEALRAWTDLPEERRPERIVVS